MSRSFRRPKIARLLPARLLVATAVGGLCALTAAAPALACAGLVTPGGNVKLLKASTLAAWADGNEHYVTSFTFQGGGAEFGSIVPLPGLPSKVERGGDWTLQRLDREVHPPAPRAASPQCANCATAADGSAEEVYNTQIDALDITILRGGGAAVGQWAKDHGFQLTPDAPETLDFYAARSPIFMAARFDADAAKQRGQQTGEGTPIHLTIPMDNPWVPLRILGLGKSAEDRIDADVYLLTPAKPNLLPAPTDGLVVDRSEQASQSLLNDLRSDKGMEWVPSQMWFTYLVVGQPAGNLRYDLAIDKSGTGTPSPVMAGLEAPPTTTTSTATTATTAAPTTTTAKPKPKPRPPITTTTAAPAPTTTAPVIDPTLSVIVDPPTTGPGSSTVALPAALPAGADHSGASPALLIAAIGGGALASGLAAWSLQVWTRRRRGGV